VIEVGRIKASESALVASLTLILVFIVAVGAWRGIYAAPEVDGPTGPIPAADPGRTRPATIESALDAATSRARTWDAHARLFSVTAQLDYPADPAGAPGAAVGGWLVYVFARGDGDDTETLTLLVERNRAEIVRETVRALGVRASGLDAAGILAAAVDSSQAINIAEAEAGQAFRIGCLPTRHVARITFQPATDTSSAAWMVSYNDSRVSNGPVLRVVVDAQTGQATASELNTTNPPQSELRECPT
jgi:hypothetical protein